MDLTAHLDESGKLKPQKKKRSLRKQVEMFGVTSLSVEDMAAYLRLPVSRIQKYMDDPESHFYKCYHRGQVLTRMKLLHTQILTATGQTKGNATMLAHLGNVLLGQQLVKKQPEEQEVTDEELLQNIPKSQRDTIYRLLAGIGDKPVEIDDKTEG
jgi:hypothetical protein